MSYFLKRQNSLFVVRLFFALRSVGPVEAASDEVIASCCCALLTGLRASEAFKVVSGEDGS